MEERRHYSKAFKVEAVRLLDLGEKPAAQLARELGIRRNLLYKWREQVIGKGDGAFSGPGHRARAKSGTSSSGGSSSETKIEEIARLKRELAATREERDILKKAAAYFARELP